MAPGFGRKETLLLRCLLVGTQSGGAHDPGLGVRRGSEGFDGSPPTQVVREVGGGDPMEAPDPFLEAAVVGIHVVDVQIRCLRQRNARRGQDMELDPGAPSECGDRRTSVAAQFRGPGNDRPSAA